MFYPYPIKTTSRGAARPTITPAQGAPRLLQQPQAAGDHPRSQQELFWKVLQTESDYCGGGTISYVNDTEEDSCGVIFVGYLTVR